MVVPSSWIANTQPWANTVIPALRTVDRDSSGFSLRPLKFSGVIERLQTVVLPLRLYFMAARGDLVPIQKLADRIGQRRRNHIACVSGELMASNDAGRFAASFFCRPPYHFRNRQSSTIQAVQYRAPAPLPAACRALVSGSHTQVARCGDSNRLHRFWHQPKPVRCASFDAKRSMPPR